MLAFPIGNRHLPIGHARQLAQAGEPAIVLDQHTTRLTDKPAALMNLMLAHIAAIGLQVPASARTRVTYEAIMRMAVITIGGDLMRYFGTKVG